MWHRFKHENALYQQGWRKCDAANAIWNSVIGPAALGPSSYSSKFIQFEMFWDKNQQVYAFSLLNLSVKMIHFFFFIQKDESEPLSYEMLWTEEMLAVAPVEGAVTNTNVYQCLLIWTKFQFSSAWDANVGWEIALICDALAVFWHKWVSTQIHQSFL